MRCANHRDATKDLIVCKRCGKLFCQACLAPEGESQCVPCQGRANAEKAEKAAAPAGKPGAPYRPIPVSPSEGPRRILIGQDELDRETRLIMDEGLDSRSAIARLIDRGATPEQATAMWKGAQFRWVKNRVLVVALGSVLPVGGLTSHYVGVRPEKPLWWDFGFALFATGFLWILIAMLIITQGRALAMAVGVIWVQGGKKSPTGLFVLLLGAAMSILGSGLVGLFPR